MNNEAARSVDVLFARGIRQDLESRTAPVGALVHADNLEFDRSNRLTRSEGFATLGTNLVAKTNVITFPVRRTAQAPSGERLLFTDQNTHVYFPRFEKMCEAGLDNQRSTIRATLQETTGIVADETGFIQYADCAAVNGYAVYAYAKVDALGSSSANSVYVDVIDVSSGTRVLTQKLVSGALTYAGSSGQVRCVVSGGSNIVFVVWFSGTGTTNIATAKLTLNTGSVTVGAAANLITDSDNPCFFDVDTMASGWVLVYGQLSGGTHKARVVTYNNTPTQGNTFTWLANAGAANWTPSALAVCGEALASATRVHAAGYDPATFKVEVVTLTNVLAGPNYRNIDPGMSHTKHARQMALGRRTSSDTQLCFSGYSSVPLTGSAAVTTNPRGHLHCYVVGDGVAGTANLSKDADFANYSLASKFYRDSRNGALFGMARFDDPSGFQSHLLLLDYGTGVANGGYGVPVPTLHVASGRVPLGAENSYTGIGGMCDLSATKAGLFQCVAVCNIGASQISGNQVNAYTLNSCNPDRFLNTPCQGEAIVGGATPLAYDGQRLVELSFYSYPVLNTGNFTPQNIGGFLAQGKYQYREVYEWTDAKGNRHQSPASPAVTVDMSGGGFAAGTNMVLIAVPAYHATRKQVQFPVGGVPDVGAAVRVVHYRTQVNSAGPFYRLALASVNNTASAADDTAIGDSYSDAQISGNEQLYEKNGGRGELATIAPPPTLFMTTHQQRLWGLDGENPERIWCTKVLADFVAPGYNQALQVEIPGAGKINGLAGQDGKLYALASNGIYLASYGDGPDNAGVGTFPSPQLLTTDATCDEPRSVLIASSGVYFAGRDKWGTGIYVIPRGAGEPVAIGRRVRDELAACPNCRGAVERIDKARVEFLFVDSDDDATITESVLLYYHYDMRDEEGAGQWTVRRPNSNGSLSFECLGSWTEPRVGGSPPFALDALVTVLADTTGAIGAQRAGTVRDFGSQYPLTFIETCDIRAWGLAGYGAIRGITIFGTTQTDDPLRIQSSYDSGATWPELVDFDPSGAAGDPRLMRWETPTQKLPEGGAIRIRVSDHIVGEQNPGITYFHGLVLEAEPLGGNARLASDRRW